LARTNANIRPLPGQQPRHPLSHRSGAAQYQSGCVRQIEVSRGSSNGRCGRGIGTVGIEKHRYAQPELWQHVPAGLRQQLLPRPDVAAANKEGGVLEIFGSAGEDGTMHQVADLLGPHTGVAKDLVRARIERHDSIEDAWLRIAIELNENFAFVHAHNPWFI